MKPAASLAGDYGQASLEKVPCPSCGQGMKYKGQKDKRVVTATGESTVQRACYDCPSCQEGYFPPG